jgi:uncharacterized protein (TIGR03437 family)
MNWTRPLQAVAIRLGLWLALAALGTMLVPVLITPVLAATFGTVVPIGGQAADIALDEPRGVLYIANFTANRVDVMSLADNTIHTSYNVAGQPASLSLSPDGNYLVIAHYGNFTAPNSPANALTVMNLNANNATQTFALGDPPLGVAFGIDNRALIVTTTNFIMFDPVNGQTTVLDSVANVTAKTLPVAPANFPPQIIAASLNTSADDFHVYGLTDTIRFHYNVLTHTVQSLGYTASPPMGPRVVSVARDGSYYTAGWALWNSSGVLLSQFASPTGALNVGSHALDSSAGLIYAQIPDATAQSAVPPTIPTTPSAPQAAPVAPPILQVVASDNLAVLQKLQLAENLAGKSLLTAKSDMLYSISDSGVTVFPVGYMNQVNRVQASQPDLVFRGNFCDLSSSTQQISIIDPGSGNTDFSLSPTVPGITLSAYSGTTPATIQVTVDPNIFKDQKGTVVAYINIQSSSAVNLPNPIRVLINNHEPEQRGSFTNIPGTLVDLVADPARNRFYVLRQDQNQVLVYDSTSNTQIAVLRTANTPTSMAITLDRKYLLVGHNDSWLMYVFDLDTLKPSIPVQMPFGHYPRSIAVSSRAILVACRVAGPVNTIDVVNLPARAAYALPTLGVYKNSIDMDTVLAAAPSGATILAASADGTVMIYDASADSFITARQDFKALSGAFAASSYGEYIVDNHLLNSSGVLSKQLESSSGTSSGFVFVDQTGIRTTAATVQAAPGVIQRVQTASGDGIRPTHIIEAPLMAAGVSGFSRTLAPLSDQSAIISLTTSGFTVLPWNYDAAVAPPQLNSVVNAADFTQPIAPGGLISVFGSQLSPINQATNELPLPTALADSCLTVNGTPIPMLFVSASQINAQLPFAVDGNAVMVLRTPGGISSNLNLTILPAAPSVFRSGSAGPQTGIPTIVRSTNNQLVTLSNPIHSNDQLVIYATGLGPVSPDVKEGFPGPTKPLAVTSLTPIVTLGGMNMPVEFAGLAPGFVGVYQINVKVPFQSPTGLSVPLTISQGGAATTLPVRVIGSK